MTLPNLSISLEDVFEFGQGYVALSRFVGFKNLVIRYFDQHIGISSSSSSSTAIVSSSGAVSNEVNRQRALAIR